LGSSTTVLKLRGWDIMHVSAATWAHRRSDILTELERRVHA
jgi:hypothetical protein